MAQNMTDKEVANMNVMSYKELRSTLRSGDLFFASGNGMVSRMIRRCSGSPWSHVGIVFHLKDINRVLLLESVESMGVRFAPLSKYLGDKKYKQKPYNGKIVLARCNNLSESVLKKVSQTGVDELTRPYDKGEVASVLARMALGRGKYKRDREYICSELVDECFYRAGRPFQQDRKGFIVPETIWVDDIVEPIGRIL